LDLENARSAGVSLDLSAPAQGAVAVVSTAIDTKVPNVDQIGRRVRFELGDTARAKLEMCIKPDGRVARVALLETSRLAAFDQALLRDATDWQFAALPGPSTIEHCRPVNIEYRAW